jgi:hypothetical protein
VQRAVQRLGGGQVAAEGFLNDEPCTLVASGLRQPLGDGAEHIGGNREIVKRTPRGAERGSNLPERLGRAIVAADVLEARCQLLECGGIDAAMPLDALTRARPQSIRAQR